MAPSNNNNNKMAGTGVERDGPPTKMVKLEADALVIPKLLKEKLRLLREAMLALDNDVSFCFNLLKITKSNAEMSVPFKNCFVKIERSSGDNQPEAERTIVYNFAGVFMKGVNILKLYLEDPEKVQEDKEVRIALQRLTQTILRIEGLQIVN